MKAIILAAGRGSRLGSITKNLPKCLIKLAGKTLLEWQINSLKLAGIDQIHIVCGFQHQKISQPYEKIINNKWPTTNMVASLFCAKHLLQNDDCIISYSDIVYSSRHVKKLISSDSSLAITYDADWLELWSQRFDNPLTDAETFQLTGDKLISIGSKTAVLEEIQGQYMGLLLFRSNLWKKINNCYEKLIDEKKNNLDMTSFLQLMIDSDIQINAIKVNGGWCEIDTYKDLVLAETKLNEKENNELNWKHDWRH